MTEGNDEAISSGVIAVRGLEVAALTPFARNDGG